MYAKAAVMPDSNPMIAPNTWFCSIEGRSIITTPAKPAMTASASKPWREGHGSPLRGFHAISAPPTRKAATHTLLM